MSLCAYDSGEDPEDEEAVAPIIKRDFRKFSRHSEVRYGGLWSHIQRLEEIVFKEKGDNPEDDFLQSLPELPKPIFGKARDPGALRSPPKYEQYDSDDEEDTSSRLSNPHWNARFGKDKDADIDMYIKLFIHHIETYGMSERRSVNIFMSSVQGPLVDALYDLPKDPKWDEVILAVRRRWCPGGTLEHLNSRFMTEVRKPQEEPREYAARLRRLSRRAHAAYPSELRDRLLREQFARGQSREIQMMMRAREFHNLDAAVAFVEKMEESIPSSGPSVVKATKARRASRGRPSRRRSAYSSDEEESEGELRQASIQESEGGSEARSTLATSPSRQSKELVIRALEEIEVDRDGAFSEDTIFTTLQVKTQNPGTGRGACFYCGRKGHGWMRCFQLREFLKKNGMRDNRPRSQDRQPRRKAATTTSTTAAVGSHPAAAGNA